eukprot:15364506-Ditylum_brightwellii.AAC.1
MEETCGLRRLNPPQGLGRGNGAASSTWALVSTPTINVLRELGYGVAHKFVISKEQFKSDGYLFVNDFTLTQIAPSPDTFTEEMTKVAQKGLDTYIDLVTATGGKVSPQNGKK